MTEEEKRENETNIDQRLAEYTCAEQYFEKNGLLKQQELALKYLKKIKKEKNNCKYGKWKELDMGNLPDKITPLFIYNCSSEKRNSIFEDVIRQLTIKLNSLDKELKPMLKQYKSYLNKNQNNLKDNNFLNF